MGVNLGPPPKLKSDRTPSVGDEMEYIPHTCHALNADHNNEYPYVLGVKETPHWVDDPNTGRKVLVEDVVEVDERRMHREVVPQLYHLDPRDRAQIVVPLRPRRPWKAVVRTVNEDGTLDLDIESNIGKGMVTLGYNRVPVDVTGLTPHSCRKSSGLTSHQPASGSK